METQNNYYAPVTYNIYNYYNTKQCSNCYQVKPVTEFYIRSDNGTCRSRCKDCHKNYNRQYRESHQDTIKQIREDYKPRRNERRRDRRLYDDQYRIKETLRCRLWHAFNSQGLIKMNTTLELTGCSLEFLTAWLSFTKQFYAPYSVNTHIDHVYPCARFDLRDVNQQLQAFNWKNLRVIDATENMKKSDTLPTQDEIITHQNLINYFLKNEDPKR